jgi:hypothetical protein
MSSTEQSSLGLVQSVSEFIAISTMLDGASILCLVGNLKRSDLKCLGDCQVNKRWCKVDREITIEMQISQP